MKVIVIGATGTIGKEIAKALADRHEVVTAGHASGDVRVDIASKSSIETFFEKVGAFDAVISAAGAAKFGPLADLSDDDFQLGLGNKLMGQVNLVRLGARHVRDNGSFTLTSGVLSQKPMKGSAAISLVNAGLEGFVRAAALEMPRGARVNVVSPVWAQETLKALNMDPSQGIPAAQFVPAYRESLEGRRNGETLDVTRFS